MGQMFKLNTVADNTLTSRFQYADSQINLNGQKMSIQNFLSLFSVLGLPAGAPQHRRVANGAVAAHPHDIITRSQSQPRSIFLKLANMPQPRNVMIRPINVT